MVGGCETEGAVVSFSEAEEATGSGGGGGGEDEGGREDKIGGGDGGGGWRWGNRWPQEETTALLAIRSDMDLAFRKATLKAPLWEEVSRKLGEVGFNRTPKKCKEKFENVYKYHKRTKDGRCRRQTGKAYKFFQQLEALDCVSPLALDAPPLPLPPSPAAAVQMANLLIQPIAAATYRDRPPNTAAVGGRRRHQDTTTTVTTRSRSRSSTEDTHDDADFAFTAASLSTDEDTTILSSSSSSGGEKDQGHGRRRRRRKRKLAALFNRLMKEVAEKQENLQRQFMDAIDKCETQRRAREEVWKAQELAKLKREQDILAQERAISAAKDAAVMAFLRKMSSSSSHNSFPSELLDLDPPSPSHPEERARQKPAAEMTLTTTMAAASAAPANAAATSNKFNNNNNNNNNNKESTTIGSSLFATTNNQFPHQIQTSPLTSASAPNLSRWPKAEVDALIRMRMDMEQRYLENGPKGLLWEEISSKMNELGYHRSSKKCKEKWENINKYFRRVKDTRRKRAEDAKTCPYFHQLDALYREKGGGVGDGGAVAVTAATACNNAIPAAVTTSSSSTTATPVHPASDNPGLHLKPEELLMQMMVQDRPHQMVRPAQQEENANNDIEGEMTGDDEVAPEDDDADFDEAQEEEEEDGDAYQIVANNNSSSMAVVRC